MLDANGLACPSIHVLTAPRAPGMISLADTTSVIREAHAIGAGYVTVPIFPFPTAPHMNAGESIPDMLGRIAREMSATDWLRIADLLNEKGAQLKRDGLHLAYHNHNLDFVPLNGAPALEFLFAHTDPEFVSFEIDT